MTTIKLGSKGDDVKVLQNKLNLYEDGIFGPLTLEAVLEFQKANGLVVDGIVGPKTWEKLGVKADTNPTTITLKKSKRNIKEIILHCSATLEGKDYTTADIKRWHLQRGFSDIGYHYVIYRDGSIHEGRNVNTSGAHCTNHNSISIGVCYIGGCGKSAKEAKDTRTDAQKESLKTLVKKLMVTYNLPKEKVFGHYQFANKACPSFKIEDFRKEIS